MAIEQWGLLALLLLLPLLEGVSRLRRTLRDVAQAPTSRRGVPLPNRDTDSVVQAAKQVAIPPPSRPQPLRQAASQPAISLSDLSASPASSSKGSGSGETRMPTQKPVASNAVVPWLRPVRNLRRAIVVATILGPPTQ
jgi:hypothetical protein